MEDPALAQAERLYKGHSTRYWPAPMGKFPISWLLAVYAMNP